MDVPQPWESLVNAVAGHESLDQHVRGALHQLTQRSGYISGGEVRVDAARKKMDDAAVRNYETRVFILYDSLQADAQEAPLLEATLKRSG